MKQPQDGGTSHSLREFFTSNFKGFQQFLGQRNPATFFGNELHIYATFPHKDSEEWEAFQDDHLGVQGKNFDQSLLLVFIT